MKKRIRNKKNKEVILEELVKLRSFRIFEPKRTYIETHHN